MKDGDMTRPRGEYGQPDSQESVIRLRGAMVEPEGGGSPELKNIRLRWTGSDYEATEEVIVFFEDSGLTPKALSEDEETFVIWRPAAQRYEEITGSSGNIIRAQVNDATGVSSGDATFAFDSAVAIVGTAPTGGTGTASNLYSQTYADNDVVILFRRKDTSVWEAERGGTAGSQIIYFELTQDKGYADAAKLAKPVDAAGAIVPGADAFYVVDDNRNFYGKAAASGEEGYRGHAWKFTDDYTGGVPGWRIIDMEGPAHFLTGVLSGSYSEAGTPFTPSTTQIWGRPSRGERLPATGSITVYDDDDVASAAKNGDKWLIAWNEAEERYTFVSPLDRYVTIKGASPGVSRSTTTFTLGSPVAVNGSLPSGTITVTNDPKLDSPSGRTIYARFNATRGDGSLGTAWDTGDGGNFVEMVRGLADWNTSDTQLVEHIADADPHWAGTGDCT